MLYASPKPLGKICPSPRSARRATRVWTAAKPGFHTPSIPEDEGLTVVRTVGWPYLLCCACIGCAVPHASRHAWGYESAPMHA